MNPEKQRIAIAEACGFKPPFFKVHEIRFGGKNAGTPIWHLPDYLNDLNAMNDAEKTLTPGPWHTYEYKLKRVTERDGVSFVHATASQRAEAFLRTLGKWEGTQPLAA
jgi:hypothetical protein